MKMRSGFIFHYTTREIKVVCSIYTTYDHQIRTFPTLEQLLYALVIVTMR